jgi:hypothetical protein
VVSDSKSGLNTQTCRETNRELRGRVKTFLQASSLLIPGRACRRSNNMRSTIELGSQSSSSCSGSNWVSAAFHTFPIAPCIAPVISRSIPFKMLGTASGALCSRFLIICLAEVTIGLLWSTATISSCVIPSCEGSCWMPFIATSRAPSMSPVVTKASQSRW